MALVKDRVETKTPQVLLEQMQKKTQNVCVCVCVCLLPYLPPEPIS